LAQGVKLIRGGGWDTFESDRRLGQHLTEGVRPFIHDFILGFRVMLAMGPLRRFQPETRTVNRYSTKNNTQGRRHRDGSKNGSSVRPKRKLMICLGWLRLFQVIASKAPRTRQVKSF
jgi:hypothetical protein